MSATSVELKRIEGELAQIPESRKALETARLNIAYEMIKYFATLNVGGILAASNAGSIVRLYDEKPIIFPYFTILAIVAAASYLIGVYYCGLCWIAVQKYVTYMQSSIVRVSDYLRTRVDILNSDREVLNDDKALTRVARKAATSRVRSRRQYEECKSFYIRAFMSFIVGSMFTSFMFLRIDGLIDTCCKIGVFLFYRYVIH
jgi:hypothetical protein